jgi:hypothetical protein
MVQKRSYEKIVKDINQIPLKKQNEWEEIWINVVLPSANVEKNIISEKNKNPKEKMEIDKKN